MGSGEDLHSGSGPVTPKLIRWFELTDGKVPPAFHTSTLTSVVVCLNYKDYDNRELGVKAFPLGRDRVALINLISEWSDEPLWDQLGSGAQEMVDCAASDAKYGFNDGTFYGIYLVQRGAATQWTVHLGLAYASLTNELTPVRGVQELPVKGELSQLWLTPQFAIPTQFEVQLPGEVNRVSRYERKWVI